MPTNQQILHNNIKKLCEIHEINLEYASKKMGLKLSTLYSFPHLKRGPYLATVVAVSKCFNVKMSDLFSNDLTSETFSKKSLSVQKVSADDLVFNPQMLYDNVIQLCRIHNITLQFFCEQVGTFITSLNSWPDSKEGPYITTLLDISKYFNITVDELVFTDLS